MIQPIVGIRKNNKNFVSLLNPQGEENKTLLLYKEDFVDGKIPLYACRMKSVNEIEKIYKIGNIQIAEAYFDELKLNADDENYNHDALKVVSSLGKNGDLSICVSLGDDKKSRPLKKYETNLFEEFKRQEFIEKDEALLDYGDFERRGANIAVLLPEDELGNTDKGIMSESFPVQKGNKVVFEDNEEENTVEPESEKKHRKVSVPGIVITLVIFILMCFGSWLCLDIQYKETTRTYKAAAVGVNKNLSEFISTKIENITASAHFVSKLYDDAESNLQLQNKIVSNFFDRNKDVYAILLPGNVELLNEKLINENKVSTENFKFITSSFKKSMEKCSAGNSEVKNVSHFLHVKSAALFYPVAVKNAADLKSSLGSMIIIFATDKFDEACNSISNAESYVIDAEGNLIAGMNAQKVLTSQNIGNEGAVKTALEMTAKSECFELNEKSSKQICSVTRNLSLDYSVVTVCSQDKLFEPQINYAKRTYVCCKKIVLGLKKKFIK